MIRCFRTGDGGACCRVSGDGVSAEAAKWRRTLIAAGHGQGRGAINTACVRAGEDPFKSHASHRRAATTTTTTTRQHYSRHELLFVEN